jgi:hypothetical protein
MNYYVMQLNIGGATPIFLNYTLLRIAMQAAYFSVSKCYKIIMLRDMILHSILLTLLMKMMFTTIKDQIDVNLKSPTHHHSYIPFDS